MITGAHEPLDRVRPRASGEPPGTMTPAVEDAVTPEPGRGLVLVVDDSPEMRGLISDVLTEEGYEVVVASSGGRALSLMAERLPDLVITDLFMPGMNGFTLRGEMLRRPDLARVPVVVLSAFWQRPSETLDVVDVLAKPLNLDRLLEVVSHAVDAGADASEARPDPSDAGATADDAGPPAHRTRSRTSASQSSAATAASGTAQGR
jgi:CheY-like chemotaxis protein